MTIRQGARNLMDSWPDARYEDCLRLIALPLPVRFVPSVYDDKVCAEIMHTLAHWEQRNNGKQKTPIRSQAEIDKEIEKEFNKEFSQARARYREKEKTAADETVALEKKNARAKVYAQRSDKGKKHKTKAQVRSEQNALIRRTRARAVENSRIGKERTC